MQFLLHCGEGQYLELFELCGISYWTDSGLTKNLLCGTEMIPAAGEVKVVFELARVREASR